ncbi:hypothetical protein J7M23_01115 [Candidatus Sumerlaeota bacterium]|nr:hypothetical protein [Candidatus Sumerlaeota bacterium]
MEIKTIISATSEGWGHLLKTEERQQELNLFREKIEEEIAQLLPDDLRLVCHYFTNKDEERNFVEREVKAGESIIYFALSFDTPGIFSLINKKCPLLYVSKPYAGHAWSGQTWPGSDEPNLLRTPEAEKVVFVMSSSNKEIIDGIRVIYATERLKRSKVLLITERPGELINYYIVKRPVGFNEIKERFGTEIVKVGSKEYKSYCTGARREDAKKIAKELINNALYTIEPKEEEIIDACQVYLGLKNMLSEYNVDALSIDCLSADILKDSIAYPCVGFSMLNSEGIPAACEGDVFSLLTMMLYRYLADIPSFITDPVIDMHRGTVIHAHCVAPLKWDGKQVHPYIIRSHAEDNRSVSLQVKAKIGEPCTVAKILETETLTLSWGSIISNPDINRGCRTKVEIAVEGDVLKLLRSWRGDLHRVLAYGSHRWALEEVARLIGLELYYETL